MDKPKEAFKDEQFLESPEVDLLEFYLNMRK